MDTEQELNWKQMSKGYVDLGRTNEYRLVKSQLRD